MARYFASLLLKVPDRGATGACKCVANAALQCGAQLARAAAFGQELRASAFFVDDDAWRAYQNRVQEALRPEKPLPFEASAGTLTW